GHCPRSKEDAQRIFHYFLTNGLKPTTTIKKADFICIYTCGGFDDTEKSSLRTIQRILRHKQKKATVIVTGCLTKINPKSMKNIHDIVLIDFDNLEQLDSLIQPVIAFTEIPNPGIIGKLPPLDSDKTLLETLTNLNYIKNIPQYLKYYLNRVHSIKLKTEEIYHVRISRGCLGSCSYCSIKFAHGPLQSKPVNQIQKDLEEGIKKGYHTFKLIGQDIGSYGVDIKTTIVEILKIFFNLPGDNKIIITDFNPRWFVKYYDLLEPLFIANHHKILNIRIPIESGSKKILRLMRRQYKIEDVKKCILRLKEKVPNLKIYTHIIVGFPGETDEDFQQTLKFLREIQFDSV
ncbi:MAG: radical SAM protein, partial [Epsilonproteobacteria bacterium]|nr:radical SAM protein [Campylobacterota bacterium]